MSIIFSNLIQKYEGYLDSGERNLREIEHSGKIHPQEYQTQRSFISIWRMVLNDLATLADNRTNEAAKKIDQSSIFRIRSPETLSNG